ncbi:AAA family ATPase (plasmid) [Enterobacter hormaechei]|uniref:AAA family ATPase n=1 Tax=Enterobacter hormaechei TaxID=158836 RepID=UPI00125D04B4|nr:ATP-binding protein [Enterobacter hormaechei]QFH87907.1 AAA family ATPase [Enterobacter hormaechei]
MIRKLNISGFKSLILEEPIELGRVNCFIGANGVGKSNILEALGVIGAAANGSVDDESLLRRGVRAGVAGLYKSSFKSERAPAHIGLEAIGDASECYRVSLLNPVKSPEPAWSFKTEYLNDGSHDVVSQGVRGKKNLNPKLGLAALKLVELDEQNAASHLMRTLQNYAIFTPNTPSLRGVAPDQQSRSPIGLNGGLLAEAFDSLRKQLNHQDNGPQLLAQVQGLIDWVNNIDVTSQASSLLSPSVPRSKHVLRFTDKYMMSSRSELTAYDASEGALYILFTACLCLLNNSPRCFSIDNLDQALNPRLLTRLVKCLPGWLLASDKEKQLLFTAHNPAVLDGLDLDNQEVRLFAVQRNNNGLTRVRRIELTDGIRKLNSQFPLSRLWLMGNLGAVPNV